MCWRQTDSLQKVASRGMGEEGKVQFYCGQKKAGSTCRNNGLLKCPLPQCKPCNRIFYLCLRFEKVR